MMSKSNDPEAFGYSDEEWELFPDEIKEQIFLENSTTDLETEPSNDDTGEFNRFDLAKRKAHLLRVFNNIAKANKRIGLASMSADHPRYFDIDKKYGIEGAIERGEKFDKKAVEELALACASCAISHCDLRRDYRIFENKYHTHNKRSKQINKLDKDIEAPC